MENWKTYKLGEITKWLSGGTPNKDRNEFWNGTIPWISANSMHTVRIKNSDLKITENGLKNGSKIAPKNSILLLVRGSALHNRIPFGIAMQEVAFNQDVKAIIPDENLVNPWFLLAWFFSKTDFLLKSVEFTGIGAGKFDTIKLQNLTINLPSLEEQERIANFAKSLDDKIELNRQMNQTLEQMAQVLYKAWFVDFEFPDFDGNLIDGLPEGWRRIKLGELIDTVSSTHKFPNDKIVFLNTSDILDGQVIEHDYSDAATLPGQAKKSIKKHDILYSEIRPANKRHAFIDFDADDYVVSTKLMVLRAKSFVDPIVIYYFLKSDEIVNLLQTLAESRSGTFPQITFQQIKNLEMIVPTAEILKPYTANLKSYSEKIRQNNDEIRRLAEIRDALLPRLISGRIPVAVK